jgi:hypothetical protein
MRRACIGCVCVWRVCSGSECSLHAALSCVTYASDVHAEWVRYTCNEHAACVRHALLEKKQCKFNQKITLIVSSSNLHCTLLKNVEV